ncbi:MAG: murein biosynthesis integral membrane protein MurJ [Acidimicrobiia bacterium]
MSDGLVRSNITVATGTALSRLTGLARVAVFGWVIGQNALADAYDGANNSPNSIYELVLGGVLAATLIPVFVRHVEDEDEDATNAVVSVAVIGLAALTAVAILAAPLIFRMSSWIVAEDIDPTLYRSVGTSLARVFLLQIFFYGLAAIGGALLNARRRFFAPAWAPVLSNIAIIAALLGLWPMLDGREADLSLIREDGTIRLVLSFGATVGIALMAVALFPAVRAAGIRLRFRPDIHHPAVAQVFKLSGWTFGYAAANIVSVYVIKNLAKPGSGGQDAYSKAFTFFQLPHGLLAMSITTTFVPDLARFVARKDRVGFVERTGLGVRLIAMLTLPAAFGFLVLRRPIVTAILQWGNFDAQDAALTSRALGGFSLGLVGFSVYLFVLRGFYAHQDARTPFVINLVENALNIVLAIVLVDRYGVLGLGLAFAVAYLLTAAWSLQIMSYKVPGFSLRPIALSLARMLLASVVMAEIVWFVARLIEGDDGKAAIVKVAAGTVIGAAVYGGLLVLLGAPEVTALRERLIRRHA